MEDHSLSLWQRSTFWHVLMSPNIDIHKAEQAMYHFEEQGDDG